MKSNDAIKAEIAELEDERGSFAAYEAQLDKRLQEHKAALRKLQREIADTEQERDEVRQAAAAIPPQVAALRRALAVLEDHAPEEPEPVPAPEIEVEADPPAAVDSEPTQADVDEAKDKANELRERRTVEGRGGYKRQPGETRTPVTEGEATPERMGKLRDEDVELVADILVDYGPMSQLQIRLMLVELLGCPDGTATSITSRALLKLRVDERAQFTGDSDDRGSKIWQAITEEARA